MKENTKNKLNKIANMLVPISILIGYAILTIGVIMFTITSEKVFSNPAGIKAMFALCLLLMPTIFILLRNKIADNKKIKIVLTVLLLIVVALFLYLVLSCLVIDYFQPLSLSSLSSTLLCVGVAFMLVGLILGLFVKHNALTMASACMLIVTMIAGTIWAGTQGYKDFTNINGKPVFLFNANESGYATFRIPSLYAVNKTSLNKKGFTQTTDPLYAFSEGRINSSHDKGDIDIVYKYSTDGGKSWSKVKTLLTFGNEVGKYGNPTVVFNEDTGTFHMFYMKASEKDNYHYQSYYCTLDFNSDLSLSVNENSIRDISLKLDAKGESGGSDGVRSDTLMVGPGKGAFLSNGEKGVIVMPCSNDKHSFVVYSLDDGKTWQNLDVENSIKSAGLGNECEATFVGNKLVMVVRENRGCSSFHSKQYQRFSVSDNFGKTWSEKTTNATSLKSPICMSSVATFNNNLVVAFPDDYHTRANLSVAIYNDNKFSKMPLYTGASGYSCITVDSDNNMYVLAEVGKVNYNENLVFMQVDTAKF